MHFLDRQLDQRRNRNTCYPDRSPAYTHMPLHTKKYGYLLTVSIYRGNQWRDYDYEFEGECVPMKGLLQSLDVFKRVHVKLERRQQNRIYCDMS